jgi:hypothetical protein
LVEVSAFIIHIPEFCDWGGKGRKPGGKRRREKEKEEGRRQESYRRIPCKEQENPPTGMSYLINK